MKKRIIPISVLFLGGLYQAQLSTSENYIYSKTYLSDPAQPNVRTAEIVQYFDGLGRPKQTINIKASPQGKDVVIPIEYDWSGRQVKDYLPIPQQSTLNGGIYTSPQNNVGIIYGNEKIYTEKIIENSPLDRIQQQIQVGTDWANKPFKFEYDVNGANEVRKFGVFTAIDPNGNEGETTLLKGTFYDSGSLYKNTVFDEDDNKTITYTDKYGSVIMVRKVLNASTNADTYYYYNNKKQLTYVIPPVAMKQITELPGPGRTTIPQIIFDNYIYQYKYDGKNRLIEKKIPGKGWEYLVYDTADRLVATQDANLKANNKWLFNKYDRFGRIIYTGIAIDNGDRNAVQTWINNMYGINTEVVGSYTQSGIQIPYGNTAYPQNIESILTINYYDKYPVGTPVFTSNISGQSTILTDNMSADLNTKGLALASYVKNIEDDNWTKSYNYYDTKARVIATHSINHLGGYTQIESILDFTGVTQRIITRHKRLSSDTEKIIDENFTYDPQNRLVKHTHRVDNNPQEEILAQNGYNELSQLKTKLVGGNSVGTGLQEVNYEYNIRGWMTKINDPSNLGNDLFGYEIKYTNPEDTSQSSAKYNGNIAEIDWRTATNLNNNKKRYSYRYDGLNRLLDGIYSEPGSSIIANNNYNENLTYDLNGNILTLKRFSKPSSGTIAELIDDLEYLYTGNRLDKIKLPVGVINNYSGYNAGQNDFAYDDNGNMKVHMDNGISSIEYNYLNLPNKILTSPAVLFNTYQLHYKYKADGQKVQKIYKTSQMDVVGNIEPIELRTDYLDGFQYSQNVNFGSVSPLLLRFIPTAEGYYDFEKNKYIYNYVDHLGNVRLNYMKGSLGLGIQEENNYYPFGLRHEVSSATGSYSNYKYSGKELQETGMYDFGARFYMADIGRWGVLDPLAEQMRSYTPYNYAFNNPIRFIDPDGRQGTDWVHNRKTNEIYWNNDATSQATTGANETYLGKSGTYTAYNGTTTALFENGSFKNDSLLGALGSMNNLDPLIQAGSYAPQMSASIFGNNDGSYIRATPDDYFTHPNTQLAMGVLQAGEIALTDVAVAKIFNYAAKGIGVFNRINGGYGFGGKLKDYKIEALYANPAAGDGAGTLFSAKKAEIGGGLFRVDYGAIHKTDLIDLHATYRFNIMGQTIGSAKTQLVLRPGMLVGTQVIPESQK